jgi:hypothetical protein
MRRSANIRLLMIACLVVAGCRRDRATSTSEADFAAALMAELVRTGSVREPRFDPSLGVIAGADGEQVWTANLYREWLALPPAERQANVRRIAQTFADTKTADTTSLDDVRGQLLPTVRAAGYFGPFEPVGDQPHDGIVVPHRQLGRATAAGIVVDLPNMMKLVTASQLADWEATLDQLESTALANLRARPAAFEQVEPGLWMSRVGDSYDSARLLLVEEIRALGLSGNPVALVPNRDLVLLAGSRDARALLAAAEHAAAAAEQPRPVHTIALCLGDEGWSDCSPDVTPEVKLRFHELATLGWAGLYEDQKPVLQDRLGDSVFVASASVVRDAASGEVFSFATWTRAVPTLLPRTDQVAFADVDTAGEMKLLGLVPWDRMIAICGPHLTSDGRSPERWATGHWFPSAEELVRLAPSRALLER